MSILKIKEVGFCTYFDKNYLLKGLCMCQSFLEHNPEAIIFVLCFDEFTQRVLDNLKNSRIKTISLEDFEDTELLKVKPSRTPVEYYWTCTPSLPLYVLKKNKDLKAVTYLDADLMFFSGVEPALKELGHKSIFTVEHHYPKGQESREEGSGRFNVAFQIFRRDKEGLACLTRWRNQCIEWCYFRYEDGKLGDQLYLNEWPDLYKNLVISKNLGIDLAPWSVGQFRVRSYGNKISVNNDKLICYHYHQFNIEDENSFEYAYGYKFSREVVELIYLPYIKHIKQQIAYLMLLDKNFKIISNKKPLTYKIKRKILKIINPVQRSFVL